MAQPLCRAGDLRASGLAHAELIRSAAARLIIFPELSLTGYELSAAVVSADDRNLWPIITACADLHTVELVGAPTRGPDGSKRLSVLAVDGVTVTHLYDKMYLGGREAESFTAGTTRSSVMRHPGRQVTIT